MQSAAALMLDTLVTPGSCREEDVRARIPKACRRRSHRQCSASSGLDHPQSTRTHETQDHAYLSKASRQYLDDVSPLGETRQGVKWRTLSTIRHQRDLQLQVSQATSARIQIHIHRVVPQDAASGARQAVQEATPSINRGRTTTISKAILCNH